VRKKAASQKLGYNGSTHKRRKTMTKKNEPKTLKEAKATIKEKDEMIKILRSELGDMSNRVASLSKAISDIKKSVPEDATEKLEVIKDLNMDDFRFIHGLLESRNTTEAMNIYHRMHL
jgi:hypothetical protein